MASDGHTLTAQKRDRVGSRYAKRLRTAGRLPAVLYGHKQDTASISVDATEALKHIEAGHRVFSISMDKQTETALLKDLQYDYLGSNIVHLDFERVNLDEEVEVSLHISFKGDAEGLKEAGAIMLHPTTELQVKCKVRTIIDHFDVDISGLGVGEILHARDIVLPSGTALVSDGDAVLAHIMVQVQEAEGEEVEVEGGGAEPQVIGDVDKAEGEAGKKEGE